MVSVNMNKSVGLVTNTTTASEYVGDPESVSIEIPPFRLHFIKFLKTVFYAVNLVSQCSHLEIWVQKEGFQLIQILGLLCMYFDAAVVFVTKSSLLFRLAVGILCVLVLHSRTSY